MPKLMTDADRWVRRDTNKMPLTTTGTLASSTNPRTWTTYKEASSSEIGVGLGFVLGGGFACIDLDHCLMGGTLTAAAVAFLENYAGHHVEISPSGDGLHIWGTAEAGPGTRTVTADGLHVERYSSGRYITVTGNIYQRGELLPL